MTSDDANSSDAERAVAIARACVSREPAKFPSAGGSPLELDRATARYHEQARRWLVWIPERTVTTRPTGRDLWVDLAAGACTLAPMD